MTYTTIIAFYFGTQATKNPKDMSLSEFIKWREEQGE